MKLLTCMYCTCMANYNFYIRKSHKQSNNKTHYTESRAGTLSVMANLHAVLQKAGIMYVEYLNQGCFLMLS